MSTKRIAVLVFVVAVGVLAGTAVAQGPPGDAGPPDDVDAGPPDDVETGPPDDVTRGPSDNVTAGPPEGVAEFVGTSPLSGPEKVDPVSLSGKIRVESQHLENTTAELVRNGSTNFTLDITVTGNATNVTFFLNKQAVEASQNIENVTMEVDGEPAEFGVNESGGENWIMFEIEHFSTRTVAFTSENVGSGDGVGGGDVPAVSENNPFGNENAEPLGLQEAADVLFQWNQNNGVVDGVERDIGEMAESLFEWNQAQT